LIDHPAVGFIWNYSSSVAKTQRSTEGSLEAWQSLLRLHLVLTDQLDHELIERHELPLAWYDVLVQLNGHGGTSTMGELTDSLLISPAGCTRVVDRMVTAGLVDRGTDAKDRRVRHVSMTAKGRGRLRAAAVTHLAGIERHFGRFLTGGEGVALAARLREMVASVDVNSSQ
jgi:DNA-binding MarR family transcriptional regulator